MTIERTVQAHWFSKPKTTELTAGHTQEIGMPLQAKQAADVFPPTPFNIMMGSLLISRRLVVEDPDTIRTPIFDTGVEIYRGPILKKDEVNQRQELLKVGGMLESLIGRRVSYGWKPTSL